MAIVEASTGSGIRVISEPMPSMRSATVGLWFDVGSRDEDTDTYGCTHFLEHLLFKGTTNRSAREIAEVLDAIGGEGNAFTGKEVTCFYVRALDRDLPTAIEVLADMACHATNTPDDVEAERDVVLEEINIHLDTPDDLVHSDIAELVFAGHRLGEETLGSVTSITGMRRETIHDHYLRHYRPGNLTVTVAGNVDPDVVVDLVERHLGDLGRPGRHDRVRMVPSAPDGVVGRVRHRPTEQAHVILGARGIPGNDPRRHALHVANTILGGAMSSRLFQRIREERGLAYSTYSYVAGHTDAGLLGAYAGTSASKVDEVVALLRDEVVSFPDSISDDEVDHARSSVLGATALGLEDTGARMTRLGHLAATGLPIVSVDEAMADIESVTPEQVRDVATLFAEPTAIAVVGPYDATEAARFTDPIAVASSGDGRTRT